MSLLATFLLLLFSFGVDSGNIPRNLIVETENGFVQGKKAETVGLNLDYYAYLGIPYAEPPIGDLRFELPVPAKNWTGILNATQDKSKCVQDNPPDGSEDCLHINVYVPDVSEYNTKPLAVMVWIFGGGFEGGFASYELYGPDYLLEKDIIVVSFNYRLGIFGFLSTDDLVAPGNNGLKDQVLALKWVQSNIINFGGDPDKVTIFGQSAGSASVSYHLQSALSKGLFHQAIMESGVSLCLWAYSRRNLEVAKIISTALSVNISTTALMVEGLKKIDYQALQKQTAATKGIELLKTDPRQGFIFSPVVEPAHESAFLTDTSHELLSKGLFSKVPVIIGFNSLEGTFNFGALFKLYLLQYDVDHTRLLPIDLNIDSAKKSEAAEKIKKFYFPNGLIALSDRLLMEFLSDDQFVRPIREFVRLLSKFAPVYYYKFSYEGNLWGYTNRTISGVAHSEELGYIWRSKFDASVQDLRTRDRLVSMWTDFAKHGNPTPKKYFGSLEITWSPTDSNFTYLDIGDELQMLKLPERYDMELWDHIFSTYGNPPYDTF